MTAADGVDGVRVFLEHHGELAGVILDLKMPRKGGRETFLEIREIDPDVPVLICSGFGDNEEAQGLITLGAKGLLPKPFRLCRPVRSARRDDSCTAQSSGFSRTVSRTCSTRSNTPVSRFFLTWSQSKYWPFIAT